MNAHALSVLELPRVLALVAERAASNAGAERVRSLSPTGDRPWIEREHARVAALRALITGEDAWSPEPIPDIGSALERLRLVGSVLRGEELLGVALLLRSSRLTREALTAEKRRSVATGVLEPLIDRLVVVRGQESAIERSIDTDGTVRDEASPTLRRIRRELRGAESELVQLLERLMRKLDPNQQVADMSVTVRNGRYVIPIRREARSSVGGIVHDESSTRATLFVEPPAAIEMGNRIRELEAEEADEVLRILATLTDELRPHHSELTSTLDSLVELDSLHARARFAEAHACAPATLVMPDEGFAIVRGRHPLLLAQGGTVIPFDLEMSADERTLLLSGPNTGGKTVLLKALGLISALVQSGVPATIGPESRVAIFDDFFADIGDEQSIAASLSTFSAHLKNLGEILDRATDRSLVLIDELGSGTDPSEGAALGGAILDELTRRGALTVATTHLGALKLLATENPAVVNASLQFDEQQLAPTYRLIKGIPGRSYGLSIARRLGLDQAVLARAEERLPRGERDVAALLADLERKDAELSEREKQLDESREHLHSRLEKLDSRERRTREAERSLERRSRQEAREYLLQARAEVEKTIRSLRESAQLSEEEIREARRRVEALVGEHGEELERLAERETPPETEERTDGAVTVGDSVEVASLGGRVGNVIELRDDQAVVAVGALKVTVPTATLTRTRRRTVEEVTPVGLRGDLPEVEAPSEIDLRGLRVEEMERSLMHALDSAVRADMRMLRIIHGKGTGALRERVAELLRGDSRVRAYRLGAWNEGGAGVTVAELA